jgi:hypothetical protein
VRIVFVGLAHTKPCAYCKLLLDEKPKQAMEQQRRLEAAHLSQGNEGEALNTQCIVSVIIGYYFLIASHVLVSHFL